jgi:PKD repeat protein
MDIRGRYAGNININANAVINFTDLSTNPVSWEWTFDGGEPATSTEQHPSVTYNTAGTFDVSLTVTNEFGSDDVIKEDYITVLLSVEDYEDETLEIFPVPAQDIINFKSSSSIDKVEIYNLSGKLINAVNCDGNSGNVDVSQLSNGTYIFKVYQTEAVKTAKVVVRR